MYTQSLGFIGGGRVTRIFLQAFANEKARFRSVSVFDTNPGVLSSLKQTYPEVKIIDSASEAAKQDYVFVALHPPVIMETLEKIRNDYNQNSTIISLAPKISIDKIQSKLASGSKVVRMIPNATSYINEGFNPVCFSSEFPDKEKQTLLKVFKVLGHTFEVSENKLESYAVMSAMLPTYFWFQWKELSEIGQKIGLEADECKDTVYETLISSLDLFFKSGLSPDDVIDLVPVKPIADHEDQIKEFYRGKLIPLFEKIKP